MNRPKNQRGFILGVVLWVTCVGCSGTREIIRKDWGMRSVTEIQRNQPVQNAPLPVTAEDFECARDKTRLEKFILKTPINNYHGGEEVIAWCCPKENVYWVFFQKGTGGSLQIQWFGPFDVPLKKQKHEARGKKQDQNKK